MLRFSREKILPLFLAMRITVAELAKKADVSHKSADKAINGKKLAAPIISKIADALNINAVEYLEV